MYIVRGTALYEHFNHLLFFSLVYPGLLPTRAMPEGSVPGSLGDTCTTLVRSRWPLLCYARRMYGNWRRGGGYGVFQVTIVF